MSPASESLVLDPLRGIRGTRDRHSQAHQEIKRRIGLLETQVGILTARNASISNRRERRDERVLRIDKRRDLVEV